MKTKICNKCGKEKAINEFYKNRIYKNDYSGCCKTCIFITKRKYIEENPEKVKAIRKSYRERNLDKFKARNKKYRQENSEKINVYQKKYRQENSEKIKAYQKRYRIQNSEKEKARHINYRERYPKKFKRQNKKAQNKYYAKHPESKRTKSQNRTAYIRFRVQKPLEYKYMLIKKRNSCSYARYLLYNRTALVAADIPDELVKLKLAQIKLNRLIKKRA